ncbi:MAG TPA: phosphatidylserine decarboxylase [Burkholderiales bacterium]|nr:phosphatidylserine decarboxylase [Burkholderiales bacterium]
MHSRYPHPIIAREGWPFLAIAVVVAACVNWLAGWWSLPFWLAALFVLQFFRDPARNVPDDPALVCSPADGRIVVVEKAQDPYNRRDALKISVFMNVFNVHSNRAPVDGEVIDVNYHAGGFFNAALDKASLENERNALTIRMKDGRELTCVQVAGLVARRILCYVERGDQLNKGQRFGFIRFGSRVDLYLSPASRPRVSVGDKVYAGETVLAELEIQSSEQ